MILEIRLPALGEGITDATITRWLLKEGDKVEKDQPIAEIATDKVDTEILSTGAGILAQILKPENTLVEINEIIALVATNNEDLTGHSGVKNNSSIKKNAGSYKSLNSTSLNNIEIKKEPDILEGKYISPFVRSLSLEYGISSHELYSLQGTGENNRITKDDILKYLSNKENTIPPLHNTDTVPVKKTKSVIPENETWVEMDRVRRVIADNMLRSKHVSPHVSSFLEANVTKLVNWRTDNKEKFKTKYQFNLTYLPIIVEAVTKALRDFPRINASLQDNFLVMKKDINIGIATALPDGNLVVPVIRNTDSLSWQSIAQNIHELSNKARNQALQLNEIKDGTFTITNAGSFGNLGGTPIILQPQLAILAVGAFVKKPVAIKTGDNYGIAIQDIVELWLSYDHRIIDGFLGGSFLKRIADYLEQFDESMPV